MPSGGLTKDLYARHHCLSLDGFKLGGLFDLSLLLRVFYFWDYQLVITYIFYQKVSVLTGLSYFKMASSLTIQEFIIRVKIMGTYSGDNFKIIIFPIRCIQLYKCFFEVSTVVISFLYQRSAFRVEYASLNRYMT